MLKNNDERCAYIRDEGNWNKCYINVEPRLIIAGLNNTPFIRISARVKGEWWTNNEPTYHELGIYKGDPSGNLDSVIPVSINEIIKWLRENKI